MAKIVCIFIITQDEQAKSIESHLVHECLKNGYGFVSPITIEDTDQNRRKIYEL